MNYRKKLGIPAYQGHKGHVAAAQSVAAPVDERAFRGRRSALDPYRHQLGTVPDSEIARLAGVTAENVRTYRQRRLISPAWQAGDSAPAPTLAARPAADQQPTPAARSTPKPAVAEKVARISPPTLAAARSAPVLAKVAIGTQGTAFLVLVDTEQGPRSYALLAHDIAEAAAHAAARVPTRHPDGTIRAIQRVAELLPS